MVISVSSEAALSALRRLMRSTALVLVAALLGPALALGSTASPATGEASCSKVASPDGSDSSQGTVESPFRTAGRLANSLAPGDVGCLRGGTYSEDEVTISAPDSRLTSYPGERAELIGRLRVTGERVLVDRLVLDGRNPDNLPSPTVNGDDVRLRRNDVSSPGSASCLILGSTGQVERPVIERNRIHDCGASTEFDHGIYMQNVNDARILSNTIYDNASRGIKVGPDSQRALISGNVIDGNPIGLNFSGNGTSASSDNVVERNVIANSTHWWNVQSYWPADLVGEGNEVRFNCLHASNPDPDYNSDGGVSDGRGYSAHDNVVAEPGYLDRAGKDFGLREDSRCREIHRSGS